MIEFYPQIRFVHILCVVLSGSLFSVRGLLMLMRSRHTNHIVLRRLSQLIDTSLLLAALFLTSMLHQYPFVQSWLTVKVVLLVVYIVLGIFALHAGRTRGVRVTCLIAALLVYAFIISVALAHHPLGIFSRWLG